MSQPPPSPPPPSSPVKRPRTTFLGEDVRSGSPSDPSWPSRANETAENIRSLWGTLCSYPMPWQSTTANLDGLIRIHSVMCEVLDAVEMSIRVTSKEHPGAAKAVPPEFKEDVPPNPTTPAPASPETPTPPTKTYAQAAKPRTTRQRGPKPKPTAQKPAAPTDPVRVTIVLREHPDLEARSMSIQAIHWRLSEAAAKVPGSPVVLGVQWSKAKNLILAFPAGTSRTAIKSLFGCVRSFLGVNGKLDTHFDVNWSYVHLANVCAREQLEEEVVSEETLRDSLMQNPAIRALNITVQPRWLRKPEHILGTHSSVMLAFEDPDGSVERNLRKSRLYAFGEAITVKKWLVNPPGRGKGLLGEKGMGRRGL